MKLTVNVLKELVKEELQELSDLKVIVNDENDRVEFKLLINDGVTMVGYLKAERLYDNYDREISETYYVDNVFVGATPKSEFRRRGLGIYLYKYAIKWLFENKSSRLVPGEYLGYQDPNFNTEFYTGTSPAARSLWNKLKSSGFIDDDFYLNEERKKVLKK